MSHGDITAGEVYKDREMLERLGYGIFDLTWSKDQVGFEDVHNFSYVVAPDTDPKVYRRMVFDILGRYYDNDLSKVLWRKFIEHKWTLSEQAGHEVDLRTAAQDWFDQFGHAFLKEWTFSKEQIPQRFRDNREPGKDFLGILTGYFLPDLRELLNSGFSVMDLMRAALRSSRPLGEPKRNWRSRILQAVPSFRYRRPQRRRDGAKEATPANQSYLVVQKVPAKEQGHFYMRLVATLTGHHIQTPQEAEKRWREILEHKWYMSEQAGHDVGIRVAALDYYRRLNLIKELEQGQES